MVFLVLIVLGGCPFKSSTVRLINLPLAQTHGLSMSEFHLDTNPALMMFKILTNQERRGEKTYCLNL